MEETGLAIIILAAGKGARMKSSLAKVLHPLASRPILSYVLEAASRLNPARTILIVGNQAEKVRAEFSDAGLEFVLQEEQLGTGHAVEKAREALGGFRGAVLILCGDMPFLKTSTLVNLVAKRLETGAACALLSLKCNKAKDFGRIVRGEDGSIQRIVENRDATAEEKMIDEYNSGVYCFDKDLLFKALDEVGDRNAQGEFYLTDTVELLRRKNLKVESIQTHDSLELFGINSAEDLKEAEIHLQKQA